MGRPKGYPKRYHAGRLEVNCVCLQLIFYKNFILSIHLWTNIEHKHLLLLFIAQMLHKLYVIWFWSNTGMQSWKGTNSLQIWTCLNIHVRRSMFTICIPSFIETKFKLII